MSQENGGEAVLLRPRGQPAFPRRARVSEAGGAGAQGLPSPVSALSGLGPLQPRGAPRGSQLVAGLAPTFCCGDSPGSKEGGPAQPSTPRKCRLGNRHPWGEGVWPFSLQKAWPPVPLKSEHQGCRVTLGLAAMSRSPWACLPKQQTPRIVTAVPGRKPAPLHPTPAPAPRSGLSLPGQVAGLT